MSKPYQENDLTLPCQRVPTWSIDYLKDPVEDKINYQSQQYNEQINKKNKIRDKIIDLNNPSNSQDTISMKNKADKILKKIN